MKQRIAYYSPPVGLCGGIKVILEHAAGLLARGWDCEVFATGGDVAWFGKPVKLRLFRDTNELGAALRSFVGIKVATWWQTAFAVQTCYRPGDQWFYLIQDEDQLSYSNDASGSSYKLGLTSIVEGQWVERRMVERYGLAPVNVGIGIDHEVFNPYPIVPDRTRVFTPWRGGSNGGGINDLKGTGTLRDVFKTLRPEFSVVTFGTQAGPGSAPVPHIHVQNPTDDHLRKLYSQAGVFLLPSKHEGFGLTALEAMACGCPVVATACHGNEEFCLDGETAIVLPVDDAKGLAEACMRVCEDEWLRKKLIANGLEMAKRYQWSKVIDKLESLYQERSYEQVA